MAISVSPEPSDAAYKPFITRSFLPLASLPQSQKNRCLADTHIGAATHLLSGLTSTNSNAKSRPTTMHRKTFVALDQIDRRTKRQLG